MATGDHGQSGALVQSLVTMEKPQDHESVIILRHYLEERNVQKHQNRLNNVMVEFHVPVSVSAALYIVWNFFAAGLVLLIERLYSALNYLQLPGSCSLSKF